MNNLMDWLNNIFKQDRPVFNELPQGIPVSEYPELAIIEGSLIFNENEPPLFNLQRIDKMIINLCDQLPLFKTLVGSELSSQLIKFYKEYETAKTTDDQKYIVNRKIIPFFKEWVFFSAAYSFLISKTNEFLFSDGKKIYSNIN